MSSGASTDDDDNNDEDVFDAVLRAVAHAPPREPLRDTSAGSKWGERYVIDRKLGSGGMGTVYLATDSLLGRQVALKVLHPSEQREPEALRERLLREARLAALVEHERIARVYDVGEHDDRLFVAMEYVRGISLREWMATPRAPSEVLGLLVQIAEGLQILHDAAVVHRDLKPENVMLPDAGGVKLLDFGLAGQVEQLPASVDAVVGSESVSTFAGTVGYIAPEGHADARADIFALGVIVHELVTGERPFPAVHGAVLADALRAKPPRCDGPTWARFPAGLAAATRRMLDVDRAARFADGRDVRGALSRLTATRASARPIWLGLGIAALTIGADLASHKALPEVHGTTPVGMALINEGEIDVGQTAEAVKAQCREIGPKCADISPDATVNDAKQNLLRVLGYQTPRTHVEVNPFYLDVHEVTNNEMVHMLDNVRGSLHVEPDEDTHLPRYVRFQAGTGSTDFFLIDLYAKHGGISVTVGTVLEFHTLPGRAKWPVVQASWFGADFYCRSQGKRLPTENEWEAAARGREDRPFPWGAAPPLCGAVNLPSDVYMAIPGCSTTADLVDVMSSRQDVTPQGIHDLGGNAAEWVSSAFVEGARNREDPNLRDGPHVIRGGSWAYSFSVHTSSRNKRPANTGKDNLGFRCAADL